MRSFYFYLLLSIILVSCSSDETPYSYLSRPDAVAETARLKLSVSADNSSFYYLIQSKEMYLIWGDGAKDTEYVLKNKVVIDSIKPTEYIYPKSGDYDVQIKTLGLIKLDLSKIDNAQIEKNKQNSISELTLTNCESITDLRFANQPIASVDLTGCTTLKTLYCGYPDGVQSLTGLDKLENLETIFINGSLGTASANFTASDSLRSISISHSGFTSLNIDGLAAVKTIVLKDNSQLSSDALNILFTALPHAKNTEYTISLSGNKGDDECDKSIAVKKGWTFK